MNEEIIIAIIGGVASIVVAVITGVLAIRSKKHDKVTNAANNIVNQYAEKSSKITQIGIQNNYDSNRRRDE